MTECTVAERNETTHNSPLPAGLPEVLVLGDLAVDWFMEEYSNQVRAERGSLDFLGPYSTGWRILESPGGALLLQRAVAEALQRARPYAFLTRGPREFISGWSGADAGRIPSELARRLPHSMARVWASEDSRSSLDGGGSANIHRRYWIDRFFNYAEAGPGGGPAKVEYCFPGVPLSNASTLVVDLAGWGFADQGALPVGLPGRLIVKLAGDLRGAIASPLWGQLVRHYAGLTKERRTLLVCADDLRNSGVAISKRLSWNRTAGDLCKEVRAAGDGSLLDRMLDFAALVIRFDLDGAAVVCREGGVADSSSVRIEFRADCGAIEGDFARAFVAAPSRRSERSRLMTGSGTTFTAGLLAHLLTQAEVNGPDGLGDAASAGLDAARRAWKAGLLVHPGHRGLSPDFSAAFAGIADASAEAADPRSAAPERFVSLGVVPDGVLSEPDVKRLATSYVLRGIGALKKLPHLVMGGLIAVDPAEVECYRGVADLLVRHLTTRDPLRPLCVGVFGRPGAGKSFGVKQIAQAIGGNRVEFQEVNVAQLSNQRELARELHSARDVVLRGRVPIIFFDEFDAAFGSTPLGWLRLFLAPMQDGRFMDDGRLHELKRAVFVFAGGTQPTMNDFTGGIPAVDAVPGQASVSADEKRRVDTERRESKVPDFVSRLQGFIDLKGPNRLDEEDRYWKLRRAILLRDLLLRQASGLDGPDGLNLSRPVLRAFLETPLKHGARSIEALIRMSDVHERSETFDISMLPPMDQLQLHVNAEEFQRHLFST